MEKIFYIDQEEVVRKAFELSAKGLNMWLYGQETLEYADSLIRELDPDVIIASVDTLRTSDELAHAVFSAISERSRMLIYLEGKSPILSHWPEAPSIKRPFNPLDVLRNLPNYLNLH
ncbi:MAG: hypothetical protein Fur0010_03070 [Bdellovibrio sp.]